MGSGAPSQQAVDDALGQLIDLGVSLRLPSINPMAVLEKVAPELRGKLDFMSALSEGDQLFLCGELLLEMTKDWEGACPS